jgi:hypothetical protein
MASIIGPGVLGFAAASGEEVNLVSCAVAVSGAVTMRAPVA